MGVLGVIPAKYRGRPCFSPKKIGKTSGGFGQNRDTEKKMDGFGKSGKIPSIVMDDA